MKNVLVTGTNSYVGSSFIEWIKLQNKNDINLTTVSVRTSEWRGLDFSKYDVVIHLAAIVHSTSTPTSEYYKVNRDLTIELAEKAKKEKVKHFIFFSTMSVYGKSIGKIDENTIENPTTHYGKSKFEAELMLKKIEDDDFQVAIIRPPMIYGKNCKGNYAKLSKFAKIINVVPSFVNERSMIYIDNLSEFLVQILLRNLNGTFFPQNQEYVSTNHLIKAIANNHRKLISETSIFNSIINLLKKLNLKFFNKIYGDLVYSKEVSRYEFNYWVNNFEESIKKTESNLNE